MKKLLILFIMATSLVATAMGERTKAHINVHESGTSADNMERERTPINLPIAVYYDSDNNQIEVWCDNDNLQAEVFIYDETGEQVMYSPYMNVFLQLPSANNGSILIKGDGWEAEGIF